MTRMTRKYKASADEMFQKVKESCERHGFSMVEEDMVSRRVIASTGWSPFSWGETMEILVSQQAEGSTVTVDSEPNVWFNLPAKERAERNAKSLLEDLKGMEEII